MADRQVPTVQEFYERLRAALGARRRYVNDPREGQATDVVLELMNPEATLTVCMFVFNPARTRTLLVKHPRFGWIPPGGHVEAGETPREAAERELLEETGTVAAFIPSRALAVTFSHGLNLGMIGYGAQVTEAATLTAETEAQWFPIDELPESSFPQDAGRIRKAARDCGLAGDSEETSWPA